jgi:hypothetical protein
MNDRVHLQILAELKSIQDIGMVHEFFVRWTGTLGRLEPVVTVWTQPAFPLQTVKDCVAARLTPLVAAGRINVLVEHG